MIGPKRLPTPRRISLPVACLALACLAAVAPASAAAEATVTYTHESRQAYEQQLAAKQIQSVTFNKRLRSMHITLTNGQHMLVKYGKGEQPTLAAQLQGKRIPVTVLKPAEAQAEAKNVPVHHKIRYIVGGVVIAIVVVVGAVLLINRRRKLAAE